ncbi:MAG: peptidylprolyl isomerase [Prevotellaceae bacterium]|jgi:peptidyl-prolyl cis-trans isomerase B (cyclophilin B)|nr:peptidylprolyl isomerase [Prevotellaceae bacterium]
MNKISVLSLSVLLFAACAKKENVKVLLETTEGNIVIRLYDDTPQHRDNFVKLVKDGYYDGVIFHRVIETFMIQGGDPDSKNPKPDAVYGKGGPDYKIPAEILPNRYHKKGVLAAARTNNPKKESSGSQFYIVQGRVYDAEELTELEQNKKINTPDFKFGEEAKKDYAKIGGTPHLDGEYSVFGEVTEGLEVVDKIAAQETNANDRPLKDVIIKKVTFVK